MKGNDEIGSVDWSSRNVVDDANGYATKYKARKIRIAK